MKRLSVIGATYRSADAPLLGELTLASDAISDHLRQLADRFHARGAMYVATCNRVELVLDGAPQGDPMQMRHQAFTYLAGRSAPESLLKETLKIWGGEGAAEHLFLVAAGMDSAQLGEREIYLQFKKSLRAARAAGTCSPLIERVVVEALRTARSVHAEIVSNDRGNVRSLAHIASEKALARASVGDEGRPRIALVGVSPMTRTCFDQLIAQPVDLVVANRTPDSALALIENTDAQWQSLEDFRKDPGRLDAVISAISVPEPVLGRAELCRIAEDGHRPLFIDMGVPPNVDPDGAEELKFERIGMQDIIDEAQSSRANRQLELASSRRILDEGVERLRLDFGERLAGPVIAGINDQYKDTLDRSVEWLLRRELSHLSDEDKSKIKAWSQDVAKRCAHIPIKGAKALAADQQVESLETFFHASDDDLVASLSGALGDLDDLELEISEAAE